MPINCLECEKVYSTRFNLNKHMRTVHNKEPEYIECASKKKYMCATCKVYFQFNNDLRKHLMDKHDVENIVEELGFDSFSAFSQWLSEEESSRKVQYVRNAGKKQCTYGFEKIYYECRRSYSKHVQTVNRKRSMRSQGSCKMKQSCTSQIIVKRNTTTDECFVRYYKSHYLHNDTDIQHLQISKKDKEVIASKLVMGVPAKGILNTTRESISSDLKRIDLITNKDIRNIKIAYKINLQDGCRHADDATSVDIWIQECQKSSYNPILFYKRQGEKVANFEDNNLSQNNNDVAQLTELINPHNKMDTCQTKDKIRSNFANILNNLDNLGEGELKLVLQQSNAWVHLSNLGKNEDPLEITGANKNEPCNINITKQKSFFSTKKKTNARKKVMTKANTQESKILAEFMNNAPVISNDCKNDHKYI